MRKVFFVSLLLFPALAFARPNKELFKAKTLTEVNAALKAGAKINGKNESGHTRLMEACRVGHIEIVEFLIKAGADVQIKASYGSTALMMAAEGGHTRVMKMLIAAKADLNAKNRNDRTALMAAAWHGHVEAVKLLLSAKADRNVIGTSGHTALKEAEHQGHAKVIEILKVPELENADHLNLLKAARAGDIVNLKKILKSVHVDATNEQGETALMVAADKGHKEIVKFLLQAKANVNAKTRSGYTPLMNAAARNHAEIVKLLIKAKTDVNAKTNTDNTALHTAAGAGATETVKLLIAAKADVHARDEHGYTPLMSASVWEKIAVAKLLLAAGAAANVRSTKENKTALDYAQKYKNVELVALLKAAGGQSATSVIVTKGPKTPAPEKIKRHQAILKELKDLSKQIDQIDAELNRAAPVTSGQVYGDRPAVTGYSCKGIKCTTTYQGGSAESLTRPQPVDPNAAARAERDRRQLLERRNNLDYHFKQLIREGKALEKELNSK